MKTIIYIFLASFFISCSTESSDNLKGHWVINQEEAEKYFHEAMGLKGTSEEPGMMDPDYLKRSLASQLSEQIALMQFVFDNENKLFWTNSEDSITFNYVVENDSLMLWEGQEQKEAMFKIHEITKDQIITSWPVVFTFNEGEQSSVTIPLSRKGS